MKARQVVDKLLEADELDLERYVSELGDINRVAREFGLVRGDSGTSHWLKPYKFWTGERMIVCLNVGVPYLERDERKAEYDLYVTCFPRVFYRVKNHALTMEVATELRKFLRDIMQVMEGDFDFDVAVHQLGKLAADHDTWIAYKKEGIRP